MSFVLHFYVLGLTSWIWTNPSTEELKFESPSKWNSYGGFHLEHWTHSLPSVPRNERKNVGPFESIASRPCYWLLLVLAMRDWSLLRSNSTHIQYEKLPLQKAPRIVKTCLISRALVLLNFNHLWKFRGILCSVEDWSLQCPSNEIWPLTLSKQPFKMQPQIENDVVTWSPQYNLPATRINKCRALSPQEVELDGWILILHIVLETYTL